MDRTKGKLSTNTDLFLAYHLIIDSIPNSSLGKGALAHYHDITNENIDSIISPSLSFSQSHDYIYNYVEPKFELNISWYEILLGMVSLVITFIFLAYSKKLLTDANWRGWVLYFVIFVILLTTSYCFLRRWIFSLGIISASVYNNSWVFCSVGAVLLSAVDLIFIVLIGKIIHKFFLREWSLKIGYLKYQKDNIVFYLFMIFEISLLLYLHIDSINRIKDFPFPTF